MVPREFRLRIQQVHLTGSTIHEEVDHGACARLMMRLRRQRLTGAENVFVKNARQRRRADPGRHLLEKSATCKSHRVGLSISHEAWLSGDTECESGWR